MNQPNQPPYRHRLAKTDSNMMSKSETTRRNSYEENEEKEKKRQKPNLVYLSV